MSTAAPPDSLVGQVVLYAVGICLVIGWTVAANIFMNSRLSDQWYTRSIRHLAVWLFILGPAWNWILRPLYRRLRETWRTVA